MMNKIYKVIWNAALQCWVAVSELGKAKGKTKSKKVLSAAAVMAVSAVGVSTNVEAAVNYATGTTFGNGMAIGSSSYANTNAAAYGHKANARALEDVAIGYNTISGAPVSGSTSHSSAQASVAVGTYANATHVATTAIGAHANATNNFATAVGAGAQATAENGSAFGQGATATGVYATALGKGALAKQDYSVALGKEAAANTQLTTSIGSKTNATGFSAIAIGSGHVPPGNTVIENIQGAQATADDSMAVGASALANKEGATALGKLSKATNNNAVAVGPDSVASGSWATATGASANASGQASAAFGESARAGGKKSIATGSHASASGENAIASGANAIATKNGATAVGANTEASGDKATALGDLAKAKNNRATALGHDSQATGEFSTAAGVSSRASGIASVATGKNATASGSNAIATGNAANATGTDSIASGRQASATGTGAVATGAEASASGNAAAYGNKAKATGGWSSAFGNEAKATQSDASAFGNSANAGAQNATAVGAHSSVTASGGTALGRGSSVAATDGVALGNGAVANRAARDRNTIVINTADPSKTAGLSDNNNGGDANIVYAPVRLVDAPGTLEAIKNTINGNKGAVSVGDSGNTRQIINVAAGSADSDAVNVAQLKAVAGGIKRYSVTSPDGSITVTNPTPGSDPQNFQIKMNTTAVQNAAAWNIKEGSESTSQSVRGGDTVSFSDTDTIDVVRSGKDFKFNAKVSSIKNGENANEGKPWTTDGDGKYLVKTKNVVDAINASGWILQANGNKVGLVNPGDKVNIASGNGITVTPTTEANGVSKITINAKVAGIKAGNNVTVSETGGVYTINANDTNTQASVANGTGLTLTESNNSNGTKKYTLGVNVDNNTIKVENGKLVANLSGVTDTNTQSTVEAKANNFVTVDGSTKNTNGTTKYQVGVTTGDVAVTEATGAVTAISAATGVATNKTVADAIAKSGFQLQENGTLRNVVNPGEILNFKPGKGTTVSVGKNGDVQINANVAGITAGKNITTNTDANGNVTINAKDTSAHVQAANNAAVKVDKAATTRTENNADITDYTVDLTDQTKTNITHGVNANETVTNKGLTFNGNTGSTGIKKLGSEVDVKGNTSNNVITTTANTNGITVDYNGTEAAKVTHLTYKANGANEQNVSLATGLNFKNGNGTTVTVGANGEVTYNANVSGLTAGDNVQIKNDGKGNFTIAATDTNTQSSVVNATSSPVTVAVSDNTNGTKQYAVDVNVDGKTITKEGGVLKAVIPSVETVTLTVNTTGNNAGKVEAPATDADKKKLVTAENVAKAVNESFWIAKKGDRVETNADTTSADSNVAAGNNVTFIAGKNIALQKAGNKFIYATKDDVSFNNVTANNTTTTNLTVKNGGNVDMGGNQVHNIANGTISNNSKDAVNGSQLYAVDNKFNNTVILGGENNSATEAQKLNKDGGLKFNIVGAENGNITTTASGTDVKIDLTEGTKKDIKQGVDANTTVTNKGLTFNANTGNTGAKKLGSEVDVKGDTANNVITTNATEAGITINYNGTEAAKVTHLTYKANGANEQNVSLATGLNFKNGNGTTVTVGANGEVTYNANVSGLTAGDNVQIKNDGKGNFTIAATDTNTQSSVVNATSSPVTVAVSDNTNGTKQYAVDVNVDGKTITKEGGVLKAVIPSVETVTLTVNTTGNNAGKVEAPATDADKKKLVTAENVAKAVNESFWIAKKGDRVETNADTTSADSNVAAGNNVTFIAGKNIALQKAGNKFIYATKDDVSFNNVTANNTTTTNLTVKNGGNVDMGGNQVHNVSTGTAPTDAVNVKQLYDTVSGNVSTESVIKKAGEDNIAEVTVADNKQSGDKNAKYEVSVSKAKIKALANETVKVNTSTAANNPITVTSHTENGNTTYSVNFNGENASKVIPLSYKANDGEAKTVTLSEGLNFKNGTQTTAEVGDNGVVKFNVNTTTLSNTTANGKITVPDGNGLVTAKEVANAINAASWNLNVSGATVQNVKAGDFVSFANGNGTTVTYKDGAVRVNANVTDVVSANGNATITRDPNTGIVTVNAKDTNTQASVKNGSGITVTPSTNANGTANYTVAVNVDGSTITVNNDGKLVANVPDTSKVSLTNNAGKVGDVSAEDANKLVTGDNLAKTINATYWKASQGTHEETTSEETTGAVSSEIKPGDELTFVSGKNMALKKDGNKFVYATKDDVTFNNVTTNNLTVNAKGNVDMGGNQVHNVANGTKGTDAVNLDQLNATTAIANAGWVIKANGTNATTVKPNATVSLNNTDGNILITKNTANNNVTFNFNPNATFGVVGKDGKDGVDGSIGVNGKDGASVVINGKDGSIGLTGPKGADGKDGVSLTLKPEKGTTTVNEKDANKEIERIKYTANGTTREVATLDDGLKFAGDDNAVINRTLGSLLNITGGAEKATVADNIRVTNDGKNGLKVQLSNNVTFNANGSVKVGDTTVNNGGLTITGGPSITKDGGVNAGDKVISNVSTGVKDNDAVNVKQLKDTVADSVSTESVIKKADEDNIAEVTVADNKQSGDKNAKYEVSVSKAKIKALANETVKVNTSTAANNPITVTSHTENGNTTYSVNFNGENASKVIPLSYKANDGEAKTVTLSEGLNFKNGTQTTAEVGDNGVVKFNVNTTALSNVTNNGKITVPEGNGLVTAKEVAEAINASYWKANAGGNVDGATVTDNVTTGTEVFFAAGKNLKVKHSANNFTFSTADDVSFNNVTTNNLTVNAKGNVDMGGNQVHNVANGTKGTDAVNLDQLNATTAIANAGWVIKANGTNATTVKPNATVSLNNTDGNILITKNTANNNVTFNFNPNATFGVVGKDGKDGVDGSIGVNGKDGASVVINGKDGSIGLTGPKGADGKDGVSVTLKPEKGTTTVNAKDDGKEIERIKYTANGTTREVATLDDGLKFKGDSKQVINRTLGSQMNITGGADETTLTDNNIGVVYDKATDGLKVKLAKDVNLTSNGSVTIGNTTLSNNGFTITNKADPSKMVSVTDKGLNNGGNTIINVAPGVNGTDAVNLDQLNATTAIANAGWVIKANGTNATTVKPNATVSLNNTDGNILITKNTANNNVTFNFNPNATFGVVGKDGKDGVDGSIGVNGKDGSSVVINGKDGSIGLNGKDGKNGLSIKGDQGPAGVDGKDGETKTRIVYEYADPKDPNKTIRENVATLNDGLRFTGNNGVENAHRLNTLVTIVGEGVDKAASANFTSASGNINVKADGKGTLEVQLAKNLKNIETINNGNSTITLNKDGGTTISGGDVSVDGNKVTNVKDGDVSANSKDAVNGSQLYHVMTNATAGWNLSVNNGKDKGNVKPGAQVDLNNTDGNIIISKTANNVTFNFNPNATFGVKGKDGKDGVDGSIGVNGKDGASVVINGKDGSIGLTGPKGADGKDGASANMSVQKGTTTVNTDRDGGKDVTRIVYTDKDKDGKDIKREVATLDDGLKFKGDSEQVINRTLGSQMNITGGADSTKLTDNNIGVVYDEATNGLKVKLSKDVDLGKDGSITIGGTQVTNNGLTIKNGPSVTEKGVDAGNKKVTNVADGDINATSKDAVNGSQLYQAVNNINKNVNAAKTELEEGDNVTITSRVGNNGQTIYKVSSTDNSAHVQGGSDAVSVTKAETTRKDGSTTVTDYTVDLSSKTKDDIKKGVDAHDTVTNKGLTFNADKGTTGAKKLGSQVAVNGDNKNIETVADTNGVKVKLKDDINVNSVTANTFKAGDTIVNTKGVQVAAKDDRGNNTNVVINEKGINAGNTRIQNVAAGRADTDAVNVSQLKGAVTQIGNHINKMDKNLRAGIAGAMAAGGLYHATLPGKSMVAAGAGTYKGESAVAVGYSRLSDNGKVGIKFSVNTNTRGDSGAAASVGYQW